jgi:putative 4-mercaptohistidine N1-methyltranferase
MNIYETDKLLGEYLLFHYGLPQEILPWPGGPADALGYPQRCVSECVEFDKLVGRERALDLGCAVGRSTFELARHFTRVVGIDYSQRFIDAANALQQKGSMDYKRTDEGDLTTWLTAYVPEDIDRSRVQFEQGDAMNLRADLGTFDLVLMANLIDRLSDPLKCLARLGDLVRPGGQLIITSPYTWMEDFTPRDNWLGGMTRDGKKVLTRDGLEAALAGDFRLRKRRDLPFLIREHRRKFQWSVADATIWQRK